MPLIPATLQTVLPAVLRQASGCATESCISNWKITFSILLVVESLLFGHIVVLVRAFSCVSPPRLLNIMRYGSAVAGGIFLSTGLLHIVPEAIHLFEKLENHAGTGTHNEPAHARRLFAAFRQVSSPHDHTEFPVVFAVILASFYGMLMVEHLLIASCQRKTVDFDEDNEDDASLDPDRSESLDLEVFGRTSINLANAIGNRDEHDEEIEVARAGYQSTAFMACFVITIGVGAHSILESVALGAAEKFSDVLNLFVAIAAHRWATSAALGIRYARVGLAGGPVVLLVFIFSLIAPIGVGFGFLATGSSGLQAQAVLFAMAAGTFIFLGSSATLEHSDSQFKMYLSSAAGSVIIVLITVILLVAKVS